MQPSQAATAAGNSPPFHPTGALWGTGGAQGGDAPQACCTQKIPAGTGVSWGKEAQARVLAVPSLHQGSAVRAATTANQLLSVSYAHSQACSLPQFPRLFTSYLPWPGKSQPALFYILGLLQLGPAQRGQPHSSLCRAGWEGSRQNRTPCLPPRSPLPPGWPWGAGSQGPRSTSTRQPTLLETLPLVPTGSLCPCPHLSAASYLHPCLPAALAGRHCHLLPAARQDMPACPRHPGWSSLAQPAGDCPCRDPSATGAQGAQGCTGAAPVAPSSRRDTFCGCPAGTKPRGQPSAHGSSPQRGEQAPPSPSRSTLLKGRVHGRYARVRLRGRAVSSVPIQGHVLCQQPGFASTKLTAPSCSGARPWHPAPPSALLLTHLLRGSTRLQLFCLGCCIWEHENGDFFIQLYQEMLTYFRL